MALKRPRPVYLDHSATTPVRPEVLEAMLPYLKDDFGNPNSPYWLGQRARKAVESAREHVAVLVGAAEAQEIIFTSSGSESDAMAVMGAAWQVLDSSAGKRRVIVSSAIEHDAVRGALGQMGRRGFKTHEIGVDEDGVVAVAEAEKLISGDVGVVSVMHANNETGTLQPVERIGALCREKECLFHTDAVQSAGKMPIEVRRIGADLLSLSSHKINGPKGVGALYARRGARLVPLIAGHQEKNRRGGTENVAGIVGFGEACRLARGELDKADRLLGLRRKIENGVLKIPGTRLNGHPERRAPHAAHFSFDGVDGHQLVVALDLEKICVSSGPACSSGSSLPSHVLTAMGLPSRWLTGALRVSVGYGTSEADVERFLGVLPGVIERLRNVAAPHLRPLRGPCLQARARRLSEPL